jgi:hypothetical protein
MTLWLRYLIAFIVACHGVTYIPFGIVIPIAEKRWRGTSWLLGSVLTQARLKALVMGLHLIAGIVILACAVAISFASGWWRPLAIIGAAIGIFGFAVFWDGKVRLFAVEGGIGVIVSLILLVSAIAFPGPLN